MLYGLINLFLLELLEIQKKIFDRAKAKVEVLIQQGEKLKDFSTKLEKENGVYVAGWCGSTECENQLKQYKGSIRCILDTKNHKKCFACESPGIHDVLIAKSY